MTIIENPQTRAALADLDCLIEDRLDTNKIATLFAARLEAEHIAGTKADVTAVETTVGQLVETVVGVTDEQLIDAVKPLLAANAKGKVQQALTNGYMLLANRARIDVSIAGEHKIQSIGTRFLSADHDVIERYALQPRQRRADSLVESTLELTALIEDRQPDMAPRIATFTERLNITWQKALGS